MADKLQAIINPTSYGSVFDENAARRLAARCTLILMPRIVMESGSKGGLPEPITDTESLTEEQKTIVQLMRVVSIAYI